MPRTPKISDPTSCLKEGPTSETMVTGMQLIQGPPNGTGVQEGDRVPIMMQTCIRRLVQTNKKEAMTCHIFGEL